ncbi:MAG: hypothetical protein HZB36_01460 [Candidatus Omnitrophica bacterium]|nr:hypothetical protein [Candidatus Omnitrophota bacterium]
MSNFAKIQKIIGLLWFGAFFSCIALAQDAGVAPLEPQKANVKTDNDEAVVEKSMDFRDPFKPWLPSKEKSVPKESEEVAEKSQMATEEVFDYSTLNVTGIVWGEAQPKAIINDNVYGIGDEINEATIVNINKDGILLKFKNKEYLIKRGSKHASKEGGEK